MANKNAEVRQVPTAESSAKVGEARIIPADLAYTPDEVSAFKFAPVVSCDTERSLSISLSLYCEAIVKASLWRNLMHHMIVHCNADSSADQNHVTTASTIDDDENDA
jgi:hypothetical protein